MNIRSYIGGDIADFTYGESPTKSVQLVGVFDFGSHPAGGDVREYWLSFENNTVVLWDSMIDGDIDDGKKKFARIADCSSNAPMDAAQFASEMLLAALLSETKLYDSDVSSAICTKVGLIGGEALSTILKKVATSSND